MSDAEAVRAKFLQALPHFRHAAKLAADQGRVMLGILAVKPDATGQVVAQFEAGEFFDDLATLLGAGPQTEEDEMDAKAQQIVDMVRASGGVIVDEAVPTGGADAAVEQLESWKVDND